MDTTMNGTGTPLHDPTAAPAASSANTDPVPSTSAVEPTSTAAINEAAAPPTTHPKRLLPESFSSTYPHGLITGEPRGPSEQEAFEARKAEILNTMSDQEIEERYQDTAKKVEEVMKYIEQGNETVDREVEGAKKTRETERKAWENMKKLGANG